MKEINKIFFTIFFILLNNALTADADVINTCGKIGYGEPANSNECIEPNEICCFVHLFKDTSNQKKFCVSSPSKIDIDDVKGNIFDYTGYELKELTCNNSSFINNSLILYLLILFLFI